MDWGSEGRGMDTQTRIGMWTDWRYIIIVIIIIVVVIIMQVT
jgi:hypothetical protein